VGQPLHDQPDRPVLGTLTLASRSFALSFITIAARLLAGQRYVDRAAR